MSSVRAGSPVMLLHGVGLSHRMWDRCLPALSRNHRVVAPDLPGHGQSPPVTPGASLSELAAPLADRLSRRVHLVGFSLGALVAQQLALTHAERIASLTLVSSVVNRSEGQAAAVAERLRAAEHDFDESANAAVDRWMTPAWQAGEPQLAAELLATLRGNDAPSYLACYRVFATADAELWPRLSEITAPTLCVTGADDPGSTPAMSRSLAAALPHGTAAVVPGVRHLLPLEAPETLATEILTHIQEVDRDHATRHSL